MVVAASDIAKGEPIAAAMLASRPFPKDFAPVGALDVESVAVERVAAVEVPKGAVLTHAMLMPKGTPGGLSLRIPAGWRAFTIQAPSASSTLAGALTGGDRVDVLFTRSAGAGSGLSAEAEMLAQNIEVLSASPKDDSVVVGRAGPGEVLSVTLLVRPEVATRLDHAQVAGNLHLSLRNPKDEAIAPALGAMADRIPPGQRAFTIPTTSIASSLAGFLLPGDFVDVLNTPKPPATGETVAILEGAKVLAVHTATETPNSNRHDPAEVLSVTILVDPEDAVRLDKAQSIGTLALALRNPEDQSKGQATPEVIPTPTYTVQRTRTLRGTSVGRDRVFTHAADR